MTFLGASRCRLRRAAAPSLRGAPYGEPVARARTLWEEGTEPGRLVVALAIAITLSAVLLDIAIHREVSWLFDLAFVGACLTVSLRVRPSDFFTVGVLPPLLMLGAFWILAIASPAIIADPGDGTVQAVVAGLARHAGALITGHALCLGVLAMRQHIYRKRASLSVRPVPPPA